MKTKSIPLRENAYYFDLWERVRSGSRDAFCTLAEDHYASLFNYARNFSTDRELIRDTIQDLYLHLWENRDSIQIEAVTVYLLRSIRNNILQTYRKPAYHTVEIEAYSGLGGDEDTIESIIISEETSRNHHSHIRKAIDSLPARQKEVIFLKYYQGLDNEQIASLTGINRQSVANLLFKAITALRRLVPHLISNNTWWAVLSLQALL